MTCARYSSLLSAMKPVLLLEEVSFLEEGKDEFKEEALLLHYYHKIHYLNPIKRMIQIDYYPL